MDNDLPPSAGSPEQPRGTPEPTPGPSPTPQGHPQPSAAPPLINPPRLYGQPRPSNWGWKITVGILAGLLLVSLFTNFWTFAQNILLHRMGPMSTTRHAGPRLEETMVQDNDSNNKILVVPIEGIISSDMLSAGDYNLVDFVRDQFKAATSDAQIRAVLLKVDSPGGEVLASDDINHIIADFQNKTGKPVVAAMGSMAASGGYYVSAPCRWIVANELTLTGSIGVIFHSYNIRGLMDKVGIRPEVYKSGKFKDMMSWDKKESDITPAEREMIQSLIDKTFQRFKTVVADGRKWSNTKNQNNKDKKGQPLVSEWADYADGRVLSGKEAFDYGFVDELGNFEAAAARARNLAGIASANLVQYRQVFDLSSLFRLFGKSDGSKVKVDLGLNAPKLKAGQLYFLAPTFVH